MTEEASWTSEPDGDRTIEADWPLELRRERHRSRRSGYSHDFYVGHMADAELGEIEVAKIIGGDVEESGLNHLRYSKLAELVKNLRGGSTEFFPNFLLRRLRETEAWWGFESIEGRRTPGELERTRVRHSVRLIGSRLLVRVGSRCSRRSMMIEFRSPRGRDPASIPTTAGDPAATPALTSNRALKGDGRSLDPNQRAFHRSEGTRGWRIRVRPGMSFEAVGMS